jgi:hypothetical protein
MSGSLKRRVSGVFRRKRPPPVMSGGLSNLSEVPEDNNMSPTLVENNPHHDQQLQDAIIESLHERNVGLEEERISRYAEGVQLKEQLRVRTDELRLLKQQLEFLDSENNRLRQQDAEIHNLKREMTAVLNNHAYQVAELQDIIKGYQVSYVKIDEDRAHFQARVEMLESENRALKQSTDIPIVEVHQQKIALEKRVATLEEELVRERAERREENKTFGELLNGKKTTDDHNKQLAKKAELLYRELEFVKAEAQKNQERMLQYIKEQQKSHETERKEGFRVLWSTVTPRRILFQRLLAQGFETSAASDGQDATLFLQSCSSDKLTNQLLDVHLSSPQAQKFAENISVDDIAILICSLCQLPKFTRKPNSQQRLGVNEFAKPSQQTKCCSKSICSHCYLATLSESLSTDWWKNLTSDNWLRCPTPDCNEPLPIRHRATLENLFRELGDKDTENKIAT